MRLGVDSGAGPVRSEGMQSARSHLNLELLGSGTDRGVTAETSVMIKSSDYLYSNRRSCKSP
jgi:hypothetical protein